MKNINPFKLIVDLFLLITSFLSAFFIKRGNFNFDNIYISIIPIMLFAWIISCFVTSKFRDGSEDKSISLQPYIYSSLYFAGSLSLIIFGLNLSNLSRFVVFGTVLLHLILEILILSGLYLPFFKKDISEKQNISFKLMITEFSLVTIGFFIIHYYKMSTFIISSIKYKYILISLYLIWFLVSLFSHKFLIDLKEQYFKLILPFLRSYLIELSIISSIIFGFNISGFSRLLVFGTIFIYAFMEILILTSGYLIKHTQKSDIPEVDFFDAPLLHEDLIVNGIIAKEKKSKKKYRFPGKNESPGYVRDKLSKIYLKNYREVFEYVDSSVDLDSVNIVKTEIMDTANPYNVNILPGSSFELFVNLHELNSFRHVNKYLIDANRILKRGGIFISRFEPMERRYFYFRKKYPRFFANLFYLFDFIWKRIFPKLPFLKKIYFIITKGRDRVFSMAQGLGRLYHCGFEIVSLTEFDNHVWFVAKKVKKPLENVTPSYATFFKQKRVGKGGKLIYIYKMRTMHPYSEFIHKYVYDRNKLDEKGKIKDDFRITSWGRILRKFWIDELPMIINWIKRDLKLVGVRPLSETFFNTYPDDLKKMRVKCKPGLIPPYYADMPKDIDEVFESERRYLESYGKKPIRTDISYFFKALKNILFKGAKSG